MENESEVKNWKQCTLLGCLVVKESEARLLESMGEGKTSFFRRADPSTCPHVHRERFCKKGETDKADKKEHEVRNQIFKDGDRWHLQHTLFLE